MEHFFTTYVRTKTVFKHRLKHLDDYDTVRIYMYELNKLSVNEALIHTLKSRGEIWFDGYPTPGNFKAVIPGPISPGILEKTKRREKVSAPLTPLHKWMRSVLMDVELKVPKATEIPVYFKAFLDFRDKQLESFFTVDSFCGRVHSPIVNLKACFRVFLRLRGEPVISLDVKQMQPLILGKVLADCVGPNAFSQALDDGKDVYILLQNGAGLQTRPEAKKFLFQLIFGKPMSEIGRIFKGDTGWVEWINSYKSRVEPMNPHREDKHTNLAWLLQYSEVQVMMGIWRCLRGKGIPFLSIHDELLCRKSDVDVVHSIMNSELKRHFVRFEVVINH